MKRIILSFVVALLATVSTSAQQIAVVKGSATQVYQTLQEAVKGAESGSVVYIPGGTFTFGDTLKIDKQLTLMGIGHNINSDNADGCTSLSGNIHFLDGSSGSSILGCYLINNIFIGESDKNVDNIIIKFCNVNAIGANNALCNNILVNQNYIRGLSNFAHSNPTITNNILSCLYGISSGIIKNNIIAGGDQNGCPVADIHNSIITNNIIFSSYSDYYLRNCQISNNMRLINWGENCISLTSWDGVFENNAGISVKSDFHFTEDYKQYSDIGIYGGTGFNKGGMPPIPYISYKKIDEQTDASGKLKISIKVKASE